MTVVLCFSHLPLGSSGSCTASPVHPTGTLNENEVGKRPWLDDFSCHSTTGLHPGDEFWPLSFHQFGYFQFNLILIRFGWDPYRSPYGQIRELPFGESSASWSNQTASEWHTAAWRDRATCSPWDMNAFTTQQTPNKCIFIDAFDWRQVRDQSVFLYMWDPDWRILFIYRLWSVTRF